ncbi:UDP-N-acetylmuramate:L-alanyl-gamma-D-glutamyl-meso-diaminopimelate ligase [Saccharophagus degradans]|uniref:UDP-N-acetylmuramate:L-alanyl-gamma-D-glutamyl- meso-diaminopimelate ligase n=1 Tax=Saccharophagus degradans TaxID=86304 RepID=UPI001C098B94|nr:UDP-N-acetylmuramate:L-alanyl-gamma-D-glutamyl-meso-diaminopimelate ligase [Saccharophagus degradans]MBU2986985.1 UDP-N-acetylmuramate:L-alanyl-gamma-D-glutamyl-meso-diaminopimelate ligase [Saccharophagus degradans]
MSKHIHILGICGTFMGSIAQLAKAMGHRVTGSDTNVYPPMSTQLELAGIELIQGFDPAQLDDKPDLVVVGNVVSRGNPAMEAVLNRGIPYISGPQWLAENWLHQKWVLAVSGTHGKTTTTSMLTWILEYAGFAPGYLIGGVPGNFESSASLGKSDFFVIEADEYDTAFFDKRAKFVHYRPRTLIINNLEFDHADIYPDLAAIQRQFHHLLRMLPADGLLLAPNGVAAIDEVVEQGFWSDKQTLGDDWQVKLHAEDGSQFDVVFDGESAGQVTWGQTGLHNVSNGLAAIAAARHIGIAPALACEALCAFKGVKRRMELVAQTDRVSLYDDFAHHPTAIQTTLEGLRAKVGSERIVAIIEPRSNTMKMGVHRQQLLSSAQAADSVLWFESADAKWSLKSELDKPAQGSQVCTNLSELVASAVSNLGDGPAHIVVMSNGGFGGIHNLLAAAIQELPHE